MHQAEGVNEIAVEETETEVMSQIPAFKLFHTNTIPFNRWKSNEMEHRIHRSICKVVRSYSI